MVHQFSVDDIVFHNLRVPREKQILEVVRFVYVVRRVLFVHDVRDYPVVFVIKLWRDFDFERICPSISRR